ncbi:MAG: PSD1 domain-containing protein [Planctomycetia bacterium]|nr:PSD1 domain-containing protein [Planctomycetia bacterium]
MRFESMPVSGQQAARVGGGHRARLPRFVSRAAAPLILALIVSAQRATADGPVDYRRDVQPILAAHCYKCHGPDEQKSGLRLDAVSTAREGGYSGPAIVPGASKESLLVKAISGSDEDVKAMPPEGPRLSSEQIATLVRWIDAGAKAPADDRPAAGTRRKSDHWSFQPVARSPAPTVQRADRVRNPIDAFILARLERERIEPSPEADRATLVRRLFLDLVGLPPSIAQVDEFLADKRADAYEQLVERLLASPHYGERWGRHWLDLARYADSNGYTNDNPRSIWKYRDWVIDALNRDLPFDQFTIQQIAGDMLPEASLDQIVATGFHRNTMINEEGGTDPEEFRVEAVVDRVGTTGAVFLGLTLACARCHDHKFDPISQRDFYGMFALLNGADEPTVPVPTPEQSGQQAELAEGVKSAEADLRRYDQETAERRAQWEQQLVAGIAAVEWTVLDPLEATCASGAATLKNLGDRSLLAEGDRKIDEIYTVTAVAPLSRVTAVRLEVLTDDSLPRHGPGLEDNGNFVLAELTLETPAVGDAKGQTAAWQWSTATDAKGNFPVEHLIDGNSGTGWSLNVTAKRPGTDRNAILALRDGLATEGRTLVFRLKARNVRNNYLPGRFRLSLTSAEGEALRVGGPVRDAIAVPADKRTANERDLVLAEFDKVDPGRRELAGKMAAIKSDLNKLTQSIPTTLAMRERDKPRETHLLIRGEYLRDGPVVPPDVPSVLPPLSTSGEQPTRLDLARWLVAPANPLVARVTMNRFWQQYFGRGLVETSNDFGTQGTPPTHPELLDWLAGEFVARGLSMKAMHRLIVTSATYRQQSRACPELAAVDPDNRLLARQSRLRVEAEAVRDVTLATSGLLSPKVGGPSVFPPQPDGVMALTRSVREWKTSTGEDRYRRGMYTYHWRSTPHPFLKVFDAPEGSTTCTRRDRANTPLQALTLLNDEACIEAARALAVRVLAESPRADAAGRVRHAFRLCLAREPSDYERACLTELLADELADAKVARDDAMTKTIQPPMKLPESADPRQYAAWTSVARALLNLDEFMTRE